MASNNYSELVTPHLKVNPGIYFYNVPEDCPAVFSTKNRTYPKRCLPESRSPPIVRSDVDAEIRRKADSLRNKFPDLVRQIARRPTNWSDLYQYFDAVELWEEVPAFLFYVMCHISNENIVLNHELEDSKNTEIRDWARMWINANVERTLSISSDQDIIAIFDPIEQDCIKGLEPKQLVVLRNALDLFRKELDHLRAPVDELRTQAHSRPMQLRQQHQPHPYHSGPYYQMQHSQQVMPQGLQMIQQGQQMAPQGQPMVARPFHMAGDEHCRSQMISMQQSMTQMHPQHLAPHIPFQHFMENRGQLPSNHLPLSGPGDFRQDTNPQWERRQRGFSNETARNGRGRNNGSFNHFGHNNRGNFNVNEGRMVTSNAGLRGSPLRRVSQMSQVSPDPVYVHDSQRQSPPFDGDATPKASGRGMWQNNQRISSDPMNNRLSNDARLWHDPQPNRQRAHSKPQEVTNDSLLAPPFNGNRQARVIVNGQKSRCIFYYQEEARNWSYQAQDPRTVYVTNFRRDDFESHRLKDLFARFGTVAYISYLYASHTLSGGGPAFIAYMDETAPELAIKELNGFQMAPGENLVVRLTKGHSRSGSQSSQNFYESNRHPNFTGAREPQYQGSNRRGSFRSQSISYRVSNNSDGTVNHTQPFFHSSDNQSPSRAPLTEGFQSQLPLAQKFSSEQLSSSLAEVVQHHAAINRYSNEYQTPLKNVENCLNTRNKENSRVHPRKFSSNRDSDMLKSQGSHNKKENIPENTPKKNARRENISKENMAKGIASKDNNLNSHTPKNKASNKSTPFTSPRNSSPCPHGAEYYQKGNGSMNKKKGSKQHSSTHSSSTPISARSSFEEKLLQAIDARQKEESATDTSNPYPKNKLVEIKNYQLEEPATIAPKFDENVISTVGDVRTLSFEDATTNPKDIALVTETPIIDAVPIAEKIEFSSSKPNITEPENRHSLVQDNHTMAPIAKIQATPVSPKPEDSEATIGVEMDLRPKKKTAGKKNKKKKPATTNSDVGVSTIPLNSKESSETLMSSESPENFVTALSSPNPSLASGPSESCICRTQPSKSKPTLESTISTLLKDRDLADIKDFNTDSNVSVGSTTMSTVDFGKSNRQNHYKKDSSSSTISASSVRKADLNSAKSDAKTDENATLATGLKDLREFQKEKQPSSPAVNFDDSAQWPSLGTAKTPLSSLIDGKPPVAQPVGERKKYANAPIIPAVPLNMQRRRPS